jgi:signal transduction histidine kinase
VREQQLAEEAEKSAAAAATPPSAPGRPALLLHHEQQRNTLSQLQQSLLWRLFYSERAAVHATLLQGGQLPADLVETTVAPMSRFAEKAKAAFDGHPDRPAGVMFELQSDHRLPERVVVAEALVWFCVRQLLSNSARFGNGEQLLSSPDFGNSSGLGGNVNSSSSKKGSLHSKPTAAQQEVSTRVKLGVKRVQRSSCGLQLRFEVTDSGAGLSRGDETWLFSQFMSGQRAGGGCAGGQELASGSSVSSSDLNDNNKGAGLGLWAVQQAVAQAGGSCGFRWTKRTHDRRSLSTFWFQVLSTQSLFISLSLCFHVCAPHF